jgi:hypothetical protein
MFNEIRGNLGSFGKSNIFCRDGGVRGGPGRRVFAGWLVVRLGVDWWLRIEFST